MFFNGLKVRPGFKFTLFIFMGSALALGMWLSGVTFEPFQDTLHPVAFNPDDFEPLGSSEQEFSALLKAAEQGNAAAQHNLGVMYDTGEGVPKDAAKAVEWYTKAAKQGHAAAQYNLGVAYRAGKGVPKDAAKAVEWYTKAAEQGQAEAQLHLGRAYANGEGVPKDAAKAVEWYTKAAEQGDAFVQYALGVAYRAGKGVPKDTAKAVEWYTKAAEQGQVDAQFDLAWAYANGEGVPKDTAKAVEWFTKVAELGQTEAQANLGVLYGHGNGVPKDAAKAVEWYTKAAEHGHAGAQISLGWAYANGEGVPKDAAKAVEWYTKAAEQGYAIAQYNLGVSYGHGNGVPKDNVLAYAWSNLAAVNGDKVAVSNRDIYERRLSSVEKAEAQRLSSGWKVGQILVREGNSVSGSDTLNSTPGILAKQSTGTAFLVSKFGQAVTNHHVIDTCKEIRVEGRDGVVTVTTSDMVNDLALIQVPYKVKETAAINTHPGKLRQGDDIAVFGFPLNSLLSAGGNLTPGIVSALTGLGNNTSQIQITASIQPGSSGSPVMNKKGEVIGVVSAKLSDLEMAKATGQIGQNVNFAVSGQTLKSFLDTHHVEYSTGSFMSFNKNAADLADEARKWTTVVECWK